MRWIDKLERKFGRFGIPNLTFIMVACYVIGYFMEVTGSPLISMFSLSPGMIIKKGQIWRLVTWILSSPRDTEVFWFVVAVFLFYIPIGRTLERTWGSFRYTLYILMGMFFTVIGAFVLYFVTNGAIGAGSTGGILSYSTFTLDHYLFGTYYISMSILFAYSVTYGEEMILLMFVIPLKMKWLGIAYGAMIAYEIVSYLSKPNTWYFAIPIIASLLNFVVFYFGTGKMHRYNPKEVVRKQKYKKAVSEGQAKAARLSKHKCAVCGRTEQDDPNLEFRFCSRCNGNYEYCNDHLFTHTHVQ